MEKPYKSGLYIVSLIFLFSFGLSLLGVYFAGVLSTKVALFLFIATLFSSAISVTILGGFFTSLVSYLIHLKRLYRYDNLSNSLLLKLSQDAPGTYHHSILVANMAAGAAKEIGADSLLCRVASYFHDVGKLKNPGFFIENQNPYLQNTLEAKLNSPQKNAQILIDHVKEGVKIAKGAHLPKEVINIIAQHHGDSTCVYFYDVAKKRDYKNTKKSEFKYEGPKPQSKEAAILMLADCLEASARVKEGYKDIKSLVENTFLDKMKEKQLDFSSLSNKDIFRLKKAFVDTLESMLHPRIEYPK